MAIENLITDHLDLWTAAVRPKNSAGRGSNSKLELTGIKKLRELILELAVSGKLVPQDASDEPASVLLERIAAEKTRSVEEGRIKKLKKLPEIREEDTRFELPKGWALVRFGHVSEHNSGKTLDQGRNQGILRDYITTSNLYWGRFDLSEVKQMPVQDSELEKCLATANDLLICEGGEAGRAAVWEQDYDICFQNHIHRARFYGGISPHYILRFFQMMSFTGEINNYRKGVGISNMSGKALSSILLPLPPIAEQNRIVAKVDELMALCDQLEHRSESLLAAHQTLVETLLATLTDCVDADELAQSWARLSAHFDTLFTTEASIDALKQTILQLAVMGKLVPQDPSDEPASSLLERIAAEKAQLVKEKKIKKEKPLSVIREDEKPFELPQGWEWERFGKIFLDLKYGTSQRSDYLIDGNPVLRIPNVAGGAISLDDLKFSKLSLTELNDLALTEGDLLFIRSNGSLGIVGRCVVVDICLDGFAFAGYLVRSRMPKRDFCSHFISLAMDTSYVRNQIEQPIRSTSGVKNINSTEISNLIIPVPPLLEQHRIVAKVNELMVICDQLKSRLQTSQQTQLALAESLVEGALA